MMRKLYLIGIILGVAFWIIVSGCMKPEPQSEIVAALQKAGSGDLASVPAPEIEDWLRRHRDLAVQVDDMCKPA